MITPITTGSPYLNTNSKIRFKSNQNMENNSKKSLFTSQEIVKTALIGSVLGGGCKVIDHVTNASKIDWRMVGIWAIGGAIMQVPIYMGMKYLLRRNSNNSN